MTKAQKRDWNYNRYKEASYTSVVCFYKKCSAAKIAAEDNIECEMRSKGGVKYRVICGNCQHFTCGYCYKLDDKWYLRVHTVGGYTDYELTMEEVDELHLC